MPDTGSSSNRRLGASIKAIDKRTRCSLMGTMIVNRKMAFFSDALGHSALTGIAVGVVFGVSDTNFSMLVFAVVFALLLNQKNTRILAEIPAFRQNGKP